MNVSPNTNNPTINLNNLKARLAATEYYQKLHGVQHNYWPHFALGNLFKNLYRYKYNYAIKAFFVVTLYREIKNYNYLYNVSFLSFDQHMHHYTLIAWTGLLTAGLFLYIWGSMLRSKTSFFKWEVERRFDICYLNFKSIKND